ncbi:hypothetical protein EJ02DRAFT_176379 [Clathrospora elynae]|uniref:Secreted protein n=1 Tax=Clathrospora elynae TaxID=706981 RepID=A0A6A5SP18_9PLEO|nr:hypothetical protein EJ02DRAFT_176379 [Clathrospora elynae]
MTMRMNFLFSLYPLTLFVPTRQPAVQRRQYHLVPPHNLQVLISSTNSQGVRIRFLLRNRLTRIHIYPLQRPQALFMVISLLRKERVEFKLD